MVTPEQDGRQLRGQQRPRGLRERADRQRHRLHHRHCADAPSGVRAGNEARSVSRMSRTGRGPAVPAATSLPQVMNCWPSRMTLSAVMAAGDEPHGRLGAAAGAPITDGHAQTAILPQPAGQAKPQLSVPAPTPSGAGTAPKTAGCGEQTSSPAFPRPARHHRDRRGATTRHCGARTAGTCRQRGPSVAVRETADGAHRP